MKKRSLRFTLTTFSASIILGIIVLFSVIAFVYLSYISEIIQKIYSMDDDFLSPIVSVLFVLITLLIIFALGASIICSLSISNRFLKTIQHFISDIQLIKKEGIKHRLEIEGNDELATLGNEFNTLMDQVEETMEKQNQFISDASHELKTPLAILKGNLEMLQRWGKEDPEILENALAVSNVEVNRLIVLCEELLHLTRETQTCDTPIEVGESIQQVCVEMNELHPSFHIDVDVDDSVVTIKEEHMKQLCIIFLDNAIKYAKENAYNIDVNFKNKVLRIKDDGIGIKEEDQDKIFDRFYKVEQSREQDNNSFGLGLSIANRLCQQYGFTLSLTSEYGKYTIFTIDMNTEKEVVS